MRPSHISGIPHLNQPSSGVWAWRERTDTYSGPSAPSSPKAGGALCLVCLLGCRGRTRIRWGSGNFPAGHSQTELDESQGASLPVQTGEVCWPEVASAAGWYPQAEAAFGASEDRRCRQDGRNSSLEAVRETRVWGFWSQETCLGVLLHSLRGVVSEDQDLWRLQGELQLRGRAGHWCKTRSKQFETQGIFVT